MQRRFQFGHHFIGTYSKHDRQGARHVFWNPTTRGYVSFNERSLHVWSP
jgi:hypothetical protein